MATSVLTTKLYVPPVRREWVLRPRLVLRLETVFRHKFALISAPAGFGKTTLLSEWADGCEYPTAWLSLDQGDNDPTRFWMYIISALQNVDASLGVAILPLLRSSSGPSIETLLTSLINEIADVSSPFALVLDDLHTITDRQVHEGLTFLVDNLPRQMHLVLSSRADPPWGLARMRVRGEMIELRANDLRFTPAEVAAFLDGGGQLGLSTAQIDALDAQTEGWIAGLQLAVLSIQGSDDVDGFIKAFSGSNRFVLDYLVEEVLERQSDDIREFLLKTSLLERLTASLCNAVTERLDSQNVLIHLDQANLFVTPLDDERRWYRYHGLFADLLASYLEEIHPGQKAALHIRASRWYEENGFIADAVGHALAAGDVEQTARLVEDNAYSAIYHGELASLIGWLKALPNEVVRSRAWLCIAYAWALTFSGQLDVVEAHLQDAETRVSQMLGPKDDRADVAGPSQNDEAEARHVKGHLFAVRTYMAAVRGDMSFATELAQAALANLPETDAPTRSFITLMLGALLRWKGDFAGASKMWTEAIATGHRTSTSQEILFALNALAAVQIEQGQLRRAAATCHDALQLADEHVRTLGRSLPFVGSVYARMSTLLREWNDLEGALRYAHEGLALNEEWRQAESLTTGYATLARALQAGGDTKGARRAMQQAREVASTLSPWYGKWLAAEEADLWLAQGDLAAAERWAEESGLTINDDLSFLAHPVYFVLARVLIASSIRQSGQRGEEQLSRGLSLLARLLELVEKAGATGTAIRMYLLQALGLQAQGNVEQALSALEQALDLAQTEGYVRVFVDEGAPMEVLLRQAAAGGIVPSYVNELLAAFPQDGGQIEDVDAQETRHPASALAEPLSEHELEVLRLLATRLSSREIAEELVIAPSTVRSHIKSIYGKLDVHRRADAVDRARALGLV